jgi:hypothetical protein
LRLVLLQERGNLCLAFPRDAIHCGLMLHLVPQPGLAVGDDAHACAARDHLRINLT